MSGASPASLHPASLPPGTLVGRWRVVEWAGRGTHGAVYRAVPADKEYAAPVALKLALIPRNPRFARAMLIDFGTGLYPEAEMLTPPDAYPGTPAYRSPESALFELQGLRTRAERYRAGLGDELYALGVTACRWLTGEYPRFSEPERDAQGVWRMEAVEVPQALEQVEPVLREPVRRLLSVRPEERGSMAQLAEELERPGRPRTSVAVRAAEPPPPAASPDSCRHGRGATPRDDARAGAARCERPLPSQVAGGAQWSLLGSFRARF